VLVIFLGACYVLGIVFDQLAYGLFKRMAKNLRKRHEIPEDIVHGNFLTEEYLTYALSRKRIVRNTALNLPPIGLTIFMLFLIRYHMFALAILSLCGCFLFSVLCFAANKRIEESYFAKLKHCIDAAEAKKAETAETEEVTVCLT
jgi:hypothetical protein